MTDVSLFRRALCARRTWRLRRTSNERDSARCQLAGSWTGSGCAGARFPRATCSPLPRRTTFDRSEPREEALPTTPCLPPSQSWSLRESSSGSSLSTKMSRLSATWWRLQSRTGQMSQVRARSTPAPTLLQSLESRTCPTVPALSPSLRTSQVQRVDRQG